MVSWVGVVARCVLRGVRRDSVPAIFGSNSTQIFPNRIQSGHIVQCSSIDRQTQDLLLDLSCFSLGLSVVRSNLCFFASTCHQFKPLKAKSSARFSRSIERSAKSNRRNDDVSCDFFEMAVMGRIVSKSAIMR